MRIFGQTSVNFLRSTKQIPETLQRNLLKRSLVKKQIAQLNLAIADVAWFLSANAVQLDFISQ